MTREELRVAAIEEIQFGSLETAIIAQSKYEAFTMTPAHITEARKALGMRVIHFAEMLGVAESAVRYWEKGQRKMPRQSFLFLRAIYRCPELRKGLPDVRWDKKWGEP